MRLRAFVLALLVVSSVALLWPEVSQAGMAATGEPLFYPCSSCHPIPVGNATGEKPKKLPNGFAGHRIGLVGHDAFGEGTAACEVCHEGADKDPGKLKLIDGRTVDITGDVSAVCYRCHSDKHAEWQAGIHGNGRAKCSSSGCHDPHSPGSIHAAPLTPFIGTGLRIEVLPERQPFTPLAAPAADPPVQTPQWLRMLTVLGVMTAAVAAGSLALERSR